MALVDIEDIKRRAAANASRPALNSLTGTVFPTKER